MGVRKDGNEPLGESIEGKIKSIREDHSTSYNVYHFYYDSITTRLSKVVEFREEDTLYVITINYLSRTKIEIWNVFNNTSFGFVDL